MISNFSELKSAIADYIGRDDLTAQIPTFVRLAEKRIERDVRMRQMERIAVCDVDSGTTGIKLPAQRESENWNVFIEMRDVSWVCNDGTVSRLEYVPVDDFRLLSSVGGIPKSYTIIGDDLYLAPVPEVDGKIYLAYYAEIPPLTEATSCNGVLHVAPDLYLYASLLESVPYTRGSGPVEIWQAAYTEAVKKVKNQENHARFTANIKMRPGKHI